MASWAPSTGSCEPGCQGTRKKLPWRSGGKTSEDNYLRIVLLGEITQASCRQAWPTLVDPPPGSPQHGLGWLTPRTERSQSRQADGSLPMGLYSMDINLGLLHQLMASTTLPKVPPLASSPSLSSF